MSRRRRWRWLLALPLVALLLYGWFMIPPRAAFPGYSVDLRLAPDSVAVGRFRVGFGQRDITPALEAGRPVWIAGFGLSRAAEGVHDPVQARAVVFDDGTHRIGLVVLDLVGLLYTDTIALRQRLPAAWGIDYLALCATHNHEGPDFVGLWGDGRLSSGRDPVWADTVHARALAAVGDAVRTLQPARLRAARTVAAAPARGGGRSGETLYRNLMRDNRPPYVMDDSLTVLGFESPDGVGLGSVVIWGNHPEALGSRNTQLSSDFPHPLRERMEEGWGGPCVFLAGAVGGLMSPLGVEVPMGDGTTSREPSFERCTRLGRLVADAALAGLRAPALEEERPCLALRAQTLRWPLDNLALYSACRLGVVARGFDDGAVRSEVGVLGLGGVQLLLCPGELYPELFYGGVERPAGADFPDAAPGPPLVEAMGGRINAVVGLANDLIGYIIPRSEWDDEEPWLYDSPKPWYGEIYSTGPGTADALVEGWRSLLEE